METPDPIYTNQASDSVKHEIDLRSKYYEDGLTTSMNVDSQNWVYKKTSWYVLRALKLKNTTKDTNTGNERPSERESTPDKETIKLVTPFKPWFVDNTEVATPYTGRQRNAEVYIPTIDNNIKVSYTKDFYAQSAYEYGKDEYYTSVNGSGTTGINYNGKLYDYGLSIYPPLEPIPDLYTQRGTIKYPLLQHAEITNDGAYGLSKKLTATFLVFDKEMLSMYIGEFLMPGRIVELSYGWSIYKDNPDCRNGVFIGSVNTYNWSLNPDGSITCTLSAVAKGMHPGSLGVTKVGFKDTSKSEYTLPPTEVPLDKIFYNYTLADIISNLDLYRQSFYDDTNNQKFVNAKNSSTSYKFRHYDPTDNHTVTGFVVYKLPLNTVQVTSDLTNPMSEDKGETTLQTYIRLDSLIHIINVLLLSNTSYKTRPFTIDVCYQNLMHEAILRTGPADFTKFIFPTEILGDPSIRTITVFDGASALSKDFVNDVSDAFSGTSVVDGNGIDFTCAQFVNTPKGFEFIQGNSIYIGAILVNVQYIKYRILNLQETVTEISYKNFLDTIFKQLAYDTGDFIKLSLLETDDSIQITNMHYDQPNKPKPIEKLMIPAIGRNSIVRGLEMSAQLPDSFAAVVAINYRAQDSISNKSISQGQIVDDATLLKEKEDFLKSLAKANEDFVNITNFAGLSRTNILDSAAYGSYMITVRRLYSSIRGLIDSVNLSIPESKSNRLYDIYQCKTAFVPIKLKFILDGLEGFEYGNVLTTNWLPDSYHDERIYFTVARIYHKLEGHDWITEVECLYRIQ